MKTKFTVKTVNKLPSGYILVSGSVEGPFLTNIGQLGYATTPAGNVRVLIKGIGVLDPNFLTKERQGILLEILEGKGILKEGVALDFDEQLQG